MGMNEKNIFCKNTYVQNNIFESPKSREITTKNDYIYTPNINILINRKKDVKNYSISQNRIKEYILRNEKK